VIGIKSELKKLIADVDKMHQKQIPFALSLTLNEVAKHGKQAVQRKMKSVFDRPTPFILKSLRIRRVSKKDIKANSKQTAQLGFKNGFGKNPFKDQVDDAIRHHIDGGARPAKASEKSLRRKGILRKDEFIVPSRALRLDRYGNIPRGTMNKILSNIGGFGEQGYKANTPQAQRTLKFIVGEVGGTRGIWSVQRNKWKPVLIFVKQPKYKKRFDFYGVATKEVGRYYASSFRKAMRYAIATAK
jgi:hypothetical protein